MDLSDLNSLPDKVKQVLEIHPNGIDILINNGGISVRSDAISTTMDTDIKIMLVNYFGTVALSKGNFANTLQCDNLLSRLSIFSCAAFNDKKRRRSHCLHWLCSR